MSKEIRELEERSKKIIENMRPQTIAQYHIKQWLDDNFIMGLFRTHERIYSCWLIPDCSTFFLNCSASASEILMFICTFLFLPLASCFPISGILLLPHNQYRRNKRTCARVKASR